MGKRVSGPGAFLVMNQQEFLANERESDFLRWIIRAAKELGWTPYHTRFSIGSQAGFPDLVLIRPGYPVIYAEVKRQGGRLTRRQQEILDLLRAASGTIVAVWYPADREQILALLTAPPP